MLQCLQAGQLGGSRLCIGGPRGLPAFRWLLGRRGSGPTPHPSSSAPPSPRPPGPRCSPAATALAVRGRGWGLAFVPALCRALPRWSCVCSAWPRPDPSAGPTGQPWSSRGPCSGAKGRRLPWVRAPGEKAEVSQASTTRCWEREASWTSKQPFASGRETGSGPRDRKWAPGLRTAPTRAPVGPASHSTDATCHCLEPIYFVFI